MNPETASNRVERCLQQVEQHPDSAAAHFNLGLAYTARGLVERAEREYRAALDLDPDLIEAWINLGGTLLLKWDFAGAADANREALRRRPDLVQAHYNLGQAHLYRGEAQELVDCCRRVVELDPEHAAGHYFLAVGLLATDRIAEARAAVARATALGFCPQPDFLRRMEQAELSPSHNQTHIEADAEGASQED